MTIALERYGSRNWTGVSTTGVSNHTGTMVQGKLIVALVYIDTVGVSVSSIHINSATPAEFTNIATATLDTGNAGYNRVEAWYCYVPDMTSGSSSIDILLSGNSNGHISEGEFGGCAASSPVDSAATGSGYEGTPTTAALTTSANGSLAVGIGARQSGLLAVSTGMTVLAQDGAVTWGISEYDLDVTTAFAALTWSAVPATKNWITNGVVVKPAASAAPTPPESRGTLRGMLRGELRGEMKMVR